MGTDYCKMLTGPLHSFDLNAGLSTISGIENKFFSDTRKIAMEHDAVGLGVVLELQIIRVNVT